jgi:hypothetical protein
LDETFFLILKDLRATADQTFFWKISSFLTVFFSKTSKLELGSLLCWVGNSILDLEKGKVNL